MAVKLMTYGQDLADSELINSNVAMLISLLIPVPNMPLRQKLNRTSEVYQSCFNICVMIKE